MTAERILEQHNLIDELGYNQRLEIIECMKEFAIHCCEKQREICAENVEMFEEGYYNSNDDEDTRWAVDKDTIINSPLPEQLL